jgi:hypothetical protein
VRTLRRSRVGLTNGRGRSVTCRADKLTLDGVVILDHPAPPEDLSPPNFEVGIAIVAMLRRDRDFLFDHLRSVSAVVDYLHRITEETSVAICDEPVRYFELANADEHATDRAAGGMDCASRSDAGHQTDPAQGASHGRGCRRARHLSDLARGHRRIRLHRRRRTPP